MPAPTLITELSQTAGSNGPVGGVDTPSVLDDYQRAHGAFIAQLRDGVGFSGQVPVANGGTGAATAAAARTALQTAISGANNDITSLSGLTAPLSILQGGTGGNNASSARTALQTAISGANNDITSLSGLTSINGGPIAGIRNVIINGGFAVNQRAYVSGAAVGADLYGHDRWKMAGSGDTYTFSTSANVTTVTIPSGKVLRQVVEGLNLLTGTYTLSWSGTAQAKIGAGSYAASGVTGAITGGTDTTIEFGPGTVSEAQLELGPVATSFEHRSVGVELLLCQRYFHRLLAGVNSYQVRGYNTAGTAISCTYRYPVPMRTTPTVVIGSVSYLNASSLSFSGNAEHATMNANVTASGDAYASAAAGSPTTFSAEL